MHLSYVPLVGILRELYSIPRGNPPDFNGMKRFRQYLRTIFPQDGSADQLLPLIAMNPMAKDHINALLDMLWAMDADGIAARTVAEVSERLVHVPGDFNVGLVIVDDLKGIGSNRFEYEFTFRFGTEVFRTTRPQGKRPRWLKDDWITGILWSSEGPTDKAVREAVLTGAYRVAHQHAHGPASSLREMLAQEGEVMTIAGCTEPVLNEEDIAYTREVLAPFLGSEDMPTCIACLFGDGAARSLGFSPIGLSPWAGIALTLHENRLNPPLWTQPKHNDGIDVTRICQQTKVIH